MRVLLKRLVNIAFMVNFNICNICNICGLGDGIRSVEIVVSYCLSSFPNSQQLVCLSVEMGNHPANTAAIISW